MIGVVIDTYEILAGGHFHGAAIRLDLNGRMTVTFRTLGGLLAEVKAVTVGAADD